eukprot:m.173711 g.173711  ORF g.173711 m.173711 type:complete len:473 (-) comp16533_c13_seq1:192-1610(-)
MDISAIMMTILMTTTTTTTTTLPRTARLGSIHGSQSSLLTSPTSPSFPPQYTETLLNLPSETTTATTLTGALTYQSQQRDSSILTQQTTGSASSQSNLQSWVPLTSDSAQPASMMSPSAVTMMPHQKQAGVMASIPSTHLPSSLSMPYRADHVDLSASPSSSSKSCHMDDQYSLSHQPQYQPQYQQHQQLQQPTIEPDALPIFEPQHVVPMLREILRQVAPHVIAQAAGGHQQQNQQQSQQQLRFCQQQQQQQHISKMASRLFGRAKPKQAGPSMTEIIANTDSRAGSVEKKINQLDEQLKQCKAKMSKMRDGPAKNRLKQQALRLLRQRKTYEQQHGMLQQQSFNMEQQNFAVQSLKDTHSTIAAMREGKNAMQQEFKKLNIDSIEDLQDDLEDMMEDHNEIQEILSRTYGMEDVDEADLEAEFEALGDEMDDALLDELTEVPTSLPAVVEESVKPNEEAREVDEFGLPYL